MCVVLLLLCMLSGSWFWSLEGVALEKKQAGQGDYLIEPERPGFIKQEQIDATQRPEESLGKATTEGPAPFIKKSSVEGKQPRASSPAILREDDKQGSNLNRGESSFERVQRNAPEAADYIKRKATKIIFLQAKLELEKKKGSNLNLGEQYEKLKILKDDFEKDHILNSVPYLSEREVKDMKQWLLQNEQAAESAKKELAKVHGEKKATEGETIPRDVLAKEPDLKSAQEQVLQVE